MIPIMSKKTRGKIGKAIHDFGMISQGNHVVVGLSGGKDSVFLLSALKSIQRWSPVSFRLSACTVDVTGGRWNVAPMTNFCERLGIPYRVVRHPIEDIMSLRDERSPCSFCANMRRGILNSTIKEMDAAVVALGHSLDDAVETALMNLFRTGRFRAFQPKLWQSNSGVTVIRPLIYLTEKAILDEVRRLELPLLPYTCPFSLKTERSRTKSLMAELQTRFPDIRQNILHALRSIDEKDRWVLEEP
ncbi:MAG: tRNA 2-thiocytidine(32) synthetase TtcA [Dethiosulfovibrio peptidovorans]|nr:MAG: tRNA 2-thiocytidine(32) synthetase TtcA [Dethiosulfovibrio peptidovorans]